MCKYNEFINEYYIVNPENFNIVHKGKISDKELKLDFNHESQGNNCG